MRIAFDGKKAAGNRAGLGNYSRFVIECMAKSYPQHEFDVYVGKDNGNPLLYLHSHASGAEAFSCPVGTFRHSLRTEETGSRYLAWIG